MSVDTPSAARRPSRLRWGVAVGAGAAIVLLSVSLFRWPAPLPSERSPGRRTLQIRPPGESGTSFSEETALRDLAPLFLPTARNAAPTAGLAPEPGRSILDAEAPKLGIAGQQWSYERQFPPAVTLEGQPLTGIDAIDTLRIAAAEGNVSGFGRRAAPLPDFPERGAAIEVVRARDGKVVIAKRLNVEVRPVPERSWQPMEFLAAVGPAGLTAPLAVSLRSGWDDVDAFFKEFLVRNFRLAERLEPGFYRVSIAP